MTFFNKNKTVELKVEKALGEDLPQTHTGFYLRIIV